MIKEGWLTPSLVLPAVDVASLDALVRKVAEALATTVQMDAEQIATAFSDALREDGFSIGGGVAIPHVAVEGLTETAVCLVTLREPLKVATIDNRPPDVFLFILSKPDPHDHLLLLAHLARLSQSRTFRNGLRQAQTSDEIVKLVRAAEQRHRVIKRPASVPPRSTHALVFISLVGEKSVDALLIALVDQGFEDACVLEGQSLREAAAREVPLFAGFRDLFGDPGGRRVLMLEAPSDRTETIIDTVKKIAEDHRAKDARVSILPMQTHWALPPAVEEKAPGGH